MDVSGKVFLFRLWEKQSARGNVYFAGRLGAASVVMFKDDFAEGDPCWQVFVQEPPKVQQSGKPAPAAPPAPEPKRRRRKARANPRAARLVGDWQPPDEPLNL